jgi:hypothetical protein
MSEVRNLIGSYVGLATPNSQKQRWVYAMDIEDARKQPWWGAHTAEITDDYLLGYTSYDFACTHDGHIIRDWPSKDNIHIRFAAYARGVEQDASVGSFGLEQVIERTSKYLRSEYECLRRKDAEVRRFLDNMPEDVG